MGAGHTCYYGDSSPYKYMLQGEHDLISLITHMIRMARNREWAKTVMKREKNLQTVSKFDDTILHRFGVT